jgi:hypothetical protein
MSWHTSGTQVGAAEKGFLRHQMLHRFRVPIIVNHSFPLLDLALSPYARKPFRQLFEKNGAEFGRRLPPAQSQRQKQGD